MIFRLTAKAAAKLKEPVVSKEPRECNPYLEWYVELLYIDNVQYLLTVNAASFLCVVLPKKGIPNTATYSSRVIPAIGEVLLDINCKDIFENVIIPGANTNRFTKTASRSVLGTIKEIVFALQDEIYHRQLSSLELSVRLNRNIWRTIGYKTPPKAFKAIGQMDYI